MGCVIYDKIVKVRIGICPNINPKSLKKGLTHFKILKDKTNNKIMLDVQVNITGFSFSNKRSILQSKKVDDKIDGKLTRIAKINIVRKKYNN